MPKLSHRLEYLGFRVVTSAALALPERVADRAGAALGRLICRLGIRRQVVLDNLRNAFPDKDETWIRQVERGSYEHLGRVALSTLRLPGIPPEQWMRQVQYPQEDIDLLRAAVERSGRGAVIVTGHIGSLEAAALTVVSLGFRLHAYFQRMSNPLVDAEVERTRAAIGIRLIDRRQGVRPGVEALLRGDCVAVVADQDARTHGVFVPFFGRLASTHRGAAVMALRANAPIFFGYARYDPAGGYVGGVREIQVSREGGPDEVIERMIAAFTASLEAEVRKAPDQYFWQHKRWKSSPPRPAEEQAERAAV